MTLLTFSQDRSESILAAPGTETKPNKGQAEQASNSEVAKAVSLRLADFSRTAPVVEDTALCKDLLEKFQEHSDCECIVMTGESGEISGLAMRNRFSYKLAHRYSVALFYNKPALQLADTAPIIVEADFDPRSLIDLAMSRQGDSLYDCIVLTSKGRFAGVLAISDLLRLSKELQLQAMRDQQVTIAAAKERVSGIEGAVESVRESVREGDSLSMRMVDLTLQGKNELTVIKHSFESLEKSSELQAERMKELERETDSIVAMSNLIKELAEQCNILAINASIEAARAGEYGRGFSVVASEIMNLANQTKKSAIDIKGMTTNIVQAIMRTSELVEEGLKQTAASGKNVEAANDAYQAIFKAAADNRVNAQRIGELAGEAHRLSAEVSEEMEQLSRSYS
ncbi:methyl-accepting chemotaxis protein [Paenibacillus soyae]|uniref:Methyl-accepting chemotaxis protein n=1 Tax=Paenibacillus soyae TaxID=2969249 RepID=A0A9X2MR40_9BACL|nr:methyl-accepting chemotaxis protein [Paenibacillus soyae]MCR2804303.1 methyl-accepting chemotaxis protein [Paenibacillus soyae]